MKALLLLVWITVWIPFPLLSQGIGIGTTNPDASALLDIAHTGKGLLIPRMTTGAVFSIANPAKGLMVYDSVKNQLMVNMGTPAAHNWQTIVANSGWNISGNYNINPVLEFIGTVDNQPLHFRVNNTGAGELNPGNGNISFGLQSGQNNTTGFSNVALGASALLFNTNRSNLVAIGDSALYRNEVGASSFTHATSNTAVGSKSLSSNTIGAGNTANGTKSLFSNINGDLNTAVGVQSLYSNTAGSFNTAFGVQSLYGNSSGTENTAIGYGALSGNAGGLGHYNTGVGVRALTSTSNSQFNTAIGYQAGNSFDNGYNNVFVGANSDASGPGYFNVVALGKDAVCTASSQARIGNSSTSSIGGQVDWTTFSDGRYKKDIKQNVAGLDFIMKLRPVTYHLDVAGISSSLQESRGKQIDPLSGKAMIEKAQILQTGFVAQDVEEAAKAAGYDFSGVDKPKNAKDFYGLRYGEFVVPLVKAMQEQQLQIETLKNTNYNLQKQIDELKALVKK